MQTPQKSLNRDANPKPSVKSSPGTPHGLRRLSLAGSQVNSPVSRSPASKSPKHAATALRRLSLTGSQLNSPASRSPASKSPTHAAAIRRSSRRPPSERSDRIAELESQISQLQEDLEKTKDLLASSESQREKAREEAAEVKEQLAEARSELERTDRQLRELCECEDDRIQELRKIGQQRDRAWQSELEAVRKQHSAESSTLVAAVNEVQRLRIHCDVLVGSEAKAGSELRSLKQELAGKDSLVEALRTQVLELENAEADYQEAINTLHLQLEVAENTITVLRTDSSKLEQCLCSLAPEPEESKASKPVATNYQEEQMAELLKELEEAKLEITALTGSKIATIDAADSLVLEQLNTAKILNSEMESELQRLKVQAQQWRKAAEMAVAMIANGEGGKAVEKVESFDSSRSSDDDKKNVHMLKKIGILLKKGRR